MSAFSDYAGLPGANWSTIKHLRRSPAHYRYVLDHGDGDSTSRLIGRALHAAVLQPDVYDAAYPVYDGDRRGKAWTDFQAAHADAAILRRVEADQIAAQVEALHAHPVAGPILATATTTEHAMQWTDPATGIACKGLLDLAGPGGIYDLKGGPSLDIFERWLIREGYHLQLAFYWRGWEALTGERPACHLIGVEAKAPHDVGVFALDEALLTIADREIEGLLLLLAECRASDRWPGRYPTLQPVVAPDWMLTGDIAIPEEGFEEEGHEL